MGKYKQPFSLFKHAKTGYYYYQTYTASGVRTNMKSTGLKSKAKALTYCTELLATNQLVPEKALAPIPTFNKLFKNYFIWASCPWVKAKLARSAKDKQKIKPLTVNTYRKLLTVHVLPYFGKYELDAITPALIDKWLLGFLKKGLSGKTGNNCKSVLNILFEDAIDRGLIEKNPVKRVKPLVNNPKRKEVVNVDDAELIFKATWLNNNYKLLYLLASITGMRLGELLALRHCDIDLENSTISINGNYDSEFGRMSVKNQVPRFITCPARLITSIKAINEASGAYYVFSPTGSKPFSANKVRDGIKKVNLQFEHDQVMNPHHWRVFFNTYLVQNNINNSKIKAVLGHAEADMTDHYTRFTVSQLSDILALQEELLDRFLV